MLRFRNILVGGYTVALFTAVSMASPLSAAQSASVAGPRIVIDNFSRVNDSYFRGAQPQGADYASLAALGVKTVINLTSHDADASEPSMVERAGMTYLQIPMTTRVQPTEGQLATFLSVVNDPAKQPVYVHCVGGRHRTGVMTAVYRMTHDGWTPRAAFAEMKQFKFGADFLHPEFKAFVYAYQPQTAPSSATQVMATQ
jgi:tyrosine-protein phosphatase SIW14